MTTDFKKAVKHAKIDAGINSNAELAELSGVNVNTLARLNSERPTLRTISKIAKACGIRVSELMALGESVYAA